MSELWAYVLPCMNAVDRIRVTYSPRCPQLRSTTASRAFIAATHLLLSSITTWGSKASWLTYLEPMATSQKCCKAFVTLSGRNARSSNSCLNSLMRPQSPGIVTRSGASFKLQMCHSSELFSKSLARLAKPAVNQQQPVQCLQDKFSACCQLHQGGQHA